MYIFRWRYKENGSRYTKGGVEALTVQAQNDKLQVRNGWLMCPRCGRGQVMKILPSTTGTNVVVYCKVCRTETVVNIESQCQCHCASARAD